MALPELDANPGLRVSLYLRAVYEGAGPRAADLSASLSPLDLSAGRNLVVPLKLDCGGAGCSSFSPGPGERQQAAMAFDPGSQKVVLFGGYRGPGVALGDTWEWDGAAWTQPALSTQPPARAGHGLAYDPQRGRVILFGGGDPSGHAAPLGDTWEYLRAPAGWQRLADTGTGPSARSLPAMATAPIGTAIPGPMPEQGVLLFGGLSASGALLGDTWVWRGASGRWEPRGVPGASCGTNPAAPACRSGGALSSVHPAGGTRQALLVGGRTGESTLGTATYDDGVWRWNGLSWARAQIETPPTALLRSQHRLVGAGDGNQLLLTGGETDGMLRQDAFVINLTSGLFVPQLGPGPQGRVGAAAAFDEERGEAVLLGGMGSGGVLNDTWTFQVSQGWQTHM